MAVELKIGRVAGGEKLMLHSGVGCTPPDVRKVSSCI